MKKATTSIDKQDFVSRNLIITGRTRHRPTLRAPTSEPMSNPGWRRAESFDLRYAIGHAVIRAVCKITLLIELCTQPRVRFVVVIPCFQFSRPELEHDDGRAKFRSRHLWSSLLSPQPLGMTCSNFMHGCRFCGGIEPTTDKKRRRFSEQCCKAVVRYKKLKAGSSSLC